MALTDEFHAYEGRLTHDLRLLCEQAISRSVKRGLGGNIFSLFLLRSLIRWERTVGNAVIEHCGVQLVDVDRAVEASISAIKKPERREGFFLLSVRELLETTSQIAAELNHDYMGTEHAVLAQIRSADEAGCILVACGVTEEQFKTHLVKMLDG